MRPITLLVLDNPTARHLSLLERLPPETRIVVGKTAEAFANSASEADAILSGTGRHALLRGILPVAGNARWVHSFSAGVENLMFPEMLQHPAVLTNGRSAFSRSLAEFTLAAALFFAKDFRRMVRSQSRGVWDQFDVEELHGKTLGIVGYGDLGRAAARLAHAFGMRVLALRRRPELSDGDRLLDAVYSLEQKHDLLAAADFVLIAAPITPQTRGLIGESELRAMKPDAVLINIGRGPVVVEEALIRALREGWIRGAALDVFDKEPLPENHAFYHLENVLLSPHCADHTPGWQNLGMEVFLRNFERFAAGQPLENVVDKTQGY
jgi:phosphoglycerate dehydrogenase-like enzyme